MVTFKRFYIIKTLTGDYYIGFLKPNWDSFDLDSDPIQIKNVFIPYSNIDYVKIKIPYREFVDTCKELGLEDREDFKLSLMEYYLNTGIDRQIVRIFAYMNDLI